MMQWGMTMNLALHEVRGMRQTVRPRRRPRASGAWRVRAPRLVPMALRANWKPMAWTKATTHATQVLPSWINWKSVESAGKSTVIVRFSRVALVLLPRRLPQ